MSDASAAPAVALTPPSLGPTYGVWLVSIFLSAILYGTGVLQTWLYFHWYPKDHWGVKASVLLLLVFETLNLCFLFAGLYDVIINHFADYPALLVISWMDEAGLLAGYLSAFVVQSYFGYIISQLNKKHFIVTAIIVALALLQIGAGIAQTYRSASVGSFDKLGSTKAGTSLQSAAALVCDIAITTALYFNLESRKTSFKETNAVLTRLIILAVNRGVLTAITAALNLILFLASPNTFYFFFGLFTSSKLYMNSMLATLNSRNFIAKAAQESQSHSWGREISLGELSANSRGNHRIPQTTDVNFGATSRDDNQSRNMKSEFVVV